MAFGVFLWLGWSQQDALYRAATLLESRSADLVRALGVAWGYHTPEELLQAGAETIAQHTQDLENLL